MYFFCIFIGENKLTYLLTYLSVGCCNTGSVETFLQHSDPSSAVKSLTSLCLIDINPSFGHDRACSSLNAAQQTHNDDILYLIYKLSQNESLPREKPYFFIGNMVSQLDAAPISILASSDLFIY